MVMEEKEERGEWSVLPAELLLSIAEYLPLCDLARLPALCGGWAWTLGWARDGWPPPPPTTFKAAFALLEMSSPWLLLPNEDGDEAHYCDLLRPCEDESGAPQVRISPLPEMAGRICVGGSPDGWIATVDIWSNSRILNPLTREEFPLPSLGTLFPYNKMTPTFSQQGDGSISMVNFTYSQFDVSFENFKYNYVQKIILSSAPPNGIVFLIHGHHYYHSYLAMARVGDLTWSPAVEDSRETEDLYQRIDDVAYNETNGKAYVITENGVLFVLDMNNYHWGSSQPPEVTVLDNMCGRQFVPGRKYVVFSSAGDLLQVLRNYTTYSKNDNEVWYMSPDVREETHNIQVFKFDPEHYDGKNPASHWIQVMDLGDDAIFLGFNHSTCISTTDKPWLRSNSVYFAEDTLRFQERDRNYYIRDAGIFDLKNDKVERFFLRDSKFAWPPPAWFFPSDLRFIS